ncbi:hypothetical protein BC351_31755 [Paenibacillus ferrarius]|uniref:Uncharacterized protein n=1 Tax=Paenibacillus ferrarius TaxID=1469647 RepID=A0A1V4HHK8_9BACL|nr:hypothetical protein BC351_31755 [Paenibacillus ferrarius]
MVAQNQSQAPEQQSRRERRIHIMQERRRSKKITRKLRAVTFNNDTVTDAGNFQFIEILKANGAKPNKAIRKTCSIA